MALLICTSCHRYFAPAAGHSTCSCCLEPVCTDCAAPHLVACRERMAEGEEERWSEVHAEMADEAA
jgi:hypothetical protein